METFKIEKLPEFEFRIRENVRAIEINAIATTMDLDSIDKTIKTYERCLECCEVKIKEQWLKCKEPGKEIYWPGTLETDALAQKQIVEYVLENLIFKAFQKSSELK